MNPVLALFLRVPLHGLGLFVAALPRSWEMALGGALGRFACAVDPKRRRIAEENIRRCLPELSPQKRGEILQANYEHYGILTLELLHIFTPIKGHWRAYAARVARLEGFDNWKRAHDKGQGTLFCSGHFANWELMAAAGAMSGIPITIVTRHLKPEWLHRWMEATRLTTGVRCAYQPRTMPPVLKGLREGRAIGFVLDQYMPPPLGMKLRFFGMKTSTLSAVAPLARRTGAKIVPVRQLRGEDGIVRVSIDPEFPLGADDAEDNQRLVDLIEMWVRDKPNQWLWAHRRFKDVEWPDEASQLRATQEQKPEFR